MRAPLSDLLDEPTRPEVHAYPEPTGPRLGRSLLELAVAVAALGYLFTFVPALLSPVLDLAALASLGAFGARWMVHLARRTRR